MAKPDSFFEFTSYKLEPKKGRVFFRYTQHLSGKKPIIFTETIQMPKPINLKNFPKGFLDRMLSDLHFILGASYYKFYNSGIVRHSYVISSQQADFWNTMYRKGLGEFYYRNKLDPNKSPKFSFTKGYKTKNFKFNAGNKFLLGFSGGKDSIVASELLKERGIKVTSFFVETNRQVDLIDDVSKKVGFEFIKVKRVLDKKVFDKHLYNGHIPISAVYAFLGFFYSAMQGFSYVVVANGHTSDFGNVKYKGFNINHQWTKSKEFENLFSQYTRNYLSGDIRYFSLLRPFYEIRIAQIFSDYKNYFQYFSGCNKNFTLIGQDGPGLWCGYCPKCVFVFTLFSAFLSKKELLAIFNKNLYKDESLLPTFKDVLGLGKMKPFDCVGTFEETKTAFLLGSEEFKSDPIVKSLRPKVKITKMEVEALFRAYKSDNAPDFYKFIGMENALILGYGKEGKVSEKFLKKEYPNLKIEVTDKSLSKNYLDLQKNFDIAIKSPGIPKDSLRIPYTTATNIFFSKVREQENIVIGVTGSKGKSTTASLIYSILKESGKDVVLLGNIGFPMLEAILKPIPKNRIFVLELSSYQLDDVKYSPNISVITNLFPEHLDFHGGVGNYFKAKKNIINFQGESDIFIYNQKVKELRNWAKSAQTIAVPFTSVKFKSNLIGKHNQDNIGAAVCVVKKFNVSDNNIQKALNKFKPLGHRLEFVGNYQGISFYDDAISTTPESTILAIEALKNVDTIFLGGQDRGYDFSQLEKAIKKYRISNVVLFPDSGNKIKIKGVKVLKTKSMKQAVSFAYKNTKMGKICLLSCASPSYSLWKDFEQKGDEFVRFVKQGAKK